MPGCQVSDTWLRISYNNIIKRIFADVLDLETIFNCVASIGETIAVNIIHLCHRLGEFDAGDVDDRWARTGEISIV